MSNEAPTKEASLVSQHHLNIDSTLQGWKRYIYCDWHRFHFCMCCKRPADLVDNQWNIPYPAWLVCRVVLAIAAGAMWWTTMITAGGISLMKFIYLSYWGYTVLVFTVVLEPFYLLAYRSYILQPEMAPKMASAPLLFKWILNNICPALCVLCTAVYWGATPDTYLDVPNITMHILNSVFAITELTIAKTPMCYAHCYHPGAFVAVYAAFTCVYWSLGGTNYLGQRYIYVALDWEDQDHTALLGSVIMLCYTAVIHILLCGLKDCVAFLATKGARPKGLSRGDSDQKWLLNPRVEATNEVLRR